MDAYLSIFRAMKKLFLSPVSSLQEVRNLMFMMAVHDAAHPVLLREPPQVAR
jgi:hypothetical protein